MSFRAKTEKAAPAEKQFISSEKQLLFILCTLVIPVALLLLIYNLYSVQVLNSEAARAAKNSIYLYQRDLEDRLSRIEATMSEYWANDGDHSRIPYPHSKLDTHIYAHNIVNQYKVLMSGEPLISSMYIVSGPGGLLRSHVGDESEYAVREAMLEKARHISEQGEAYSMGGWFPQCLGGKYFLIRIMGRGGAKTICMVDLERGVKPQDSPDTDHNALLVYVDSAGNPLTSLEFAALHGLEFQAGSRAYAITGQASRYFMVQTFSPYCGLYFAYLQPYSGLFSFINPVQLIFLLASFLILALIPICFLLLRRLYLRPMDSLLHTMGRIKSGDLEPRLENGQRIAEFHQVSVVFNEMMEEICHLKIESYENELLYQKAQRQYLQIQIKPHFFLNYLKTLYGMAEQKLYDKVQRAILLISDHLRYIFRDNMELVPLGTELGHIQNYVEMQRYAMPYPITHTVAVEEGAQDFPVPTLCVQTFVENCFKHGVREGVPLEIGTTVTLLHSDEGDSVDITISNNGHPLSPRQLAEFNGELSFAYQDTNVGILNIRQRLYLLYGDRAGFACMNSGPGVVFELVIPLCQAKGALFDAAAGK